MAAVLWYIAREGHKIGPFSSAEITQLAQLGLLQSAEMVWTEGLSKWVEASQFPALFPHEGEQRYWLSLGGKTRGPFGTRQVRAGLTAKEIALDAQACPENGKEWQPLNKLTEFRDFVAPPVSPSQARLMSGMMDAEEAALHLAGKSGDAIARLMSMLMDLQKKHTDNPSLVLSLEKSLDVLRSRRDEMEKAGAL